MSIIFAGTSFADFETGVGSYVNSARQGPDVLEAVETTASISARTPVFSAVTSLWLAAYFYKTNFNNEPLIVFYDSADNEIFCIRGYNDSPQKWDLCAGPSRTVLASATAAVVSQDTLYRVDVELVVNDTTGKFNTYINGAAFVSFSGDTLVGSGTDIARVAFFSDYDSAYWSAVIIADEDTRGMSFVQSKPSGAGGASDWTGAYTDIDETGYTDTDVLSASAAAKVSTFAMADLPSGYSTGYDVVATVLAGRMKAGASASIKAVYRVGSTNYTGADFGAGAAFAGKQVIATVDPSTSAAWTVSGVNAAEFGFESA